MNIFECIKPECTRPTTVRAGPMDPDSQNFGLDFGPDTFRLSGPMISARFDNLSAKYFYFSTGTGALIATGLRTTSGQVKIHWQIIVS